MIDNIDKAVDRIRKLLALSKDGGATEAEASLAAEMAQRVMEEHNLSMATVEARGGSSGADGKREKSQFTNKAPYKWMRTLMAEVGKLNFCYVEEKWERKGEYGGSRTSTFVGYSVIGRAANVASTSVTFDYLVQSINRLAAEEVDGDAQRLFTRYAASFREGCCDRVVERLRVKREQALQEQERKAREDNARARHPNAAPGTSLVVVLRDYVQDEEDLNNDYRQGWEPGTTAQRRKEQELSNAEYRRKRELRKAELEAQYPDDPDMVLYRLHGYSEEDVLKIREKETKAARPETDAQRRKREEQERNRRRREDERYWRQQSKRDWRGYQKGSEAGDRVGLDPQVDAGCRSKIGN